MANEGQRPTGSDSKKDLVSSASSTHLRIVEHANGALTSPRPAAEVPEMQLGERDGQKRRWPVILSFVLVVVLPTLAAVYFLTQIATPRYLGETRVAVRTTQAPSFTGMGEMLGLPGQSPVSQDAQALVQYLQSRAVLDDLSGEPGLDLAQIFGGPGIDPFSRLSSTATVEDLLTVWRSRVRSSFEGSNNTVLIKVTAFTPGDTLALSKAILTLSDTFINELSDNARLDSVTFARSEVARSEARLTEARAALVRFQGREAMLDPSVNASADLTRANSLRDRITSQRAMLATQLTQLGPEAPSVKANEQIISGLESELARIKVESATSGVAAGSARPVAEIMREFQEVSAEVEFAQRAYESALSSYEAARVDADRRHVFLATVVAPALPEKAAFPQPLPDTLTVLLVALALWLLGLLAINSIRDHL